MTRQIRQYGNDVYLLSETGVGAQRWIKKTQKFSGQMYVRRYVHEHGTPVPADHPAWAWLAKQARDEGQFLPGAPGFRTFF